jgi:predicted metalloendopeptidase
VRKNGPEQLLPGLNFTQNQLFFINFGQIWCGKYRDQSLITRIMTHEHPPGEFRVMGSTSNFDEFAKAFKCKPNQVNNPEKKCSLW